MALISLSRRGVRTGSCIQRLELLVQALERGLAGSSGRSAAYVAKDVIAEEPEAVGNVVDVAHLELKVTDGGGPEGLSQGIHGMHRRGLRRHEQNGYAVERGCPRTTLDANGVAIVAAAIMLAASSSWGRLR
jgi:hypothetical protein